MHDIIEQYKDAIIALVGAGSTLAMLSWSFTTYFQIVENMLNAVFYK